MKPYRTILCFICLLPSLLIKAQQKDSLTILKEFEPYRSASANTDVSYIFFENFVKNPDNVKYYPYFVGIAYEELGMIYSNRGELHKGIALYDSSYIYAVRSHDSIGMGTAMNWIGISYQYLGLNNLAIQHYLKAYEIGQKTGDIRRSNSYISNVGSLYFSMKQFENSLKYSRIAIEESRKASSPIDANLARTYADLALVFLHLNQIDSAKLYNLEAQRISIETNDTIPMVDVHLNNYRIYQTENFPLALAELKLGTALIERYNSTGSISEFKLAEAYELNAMLAMAHNRGDDAIIYLNKSLETAKKINSLATISSSYEGLMHAFAANKDYQNAFKYAALFKKTSDSLFSVEKEKIVQENAIVFETELKEKEIALKNNELIISEETIRNKNILIGAASVLMIFISAGAYFAFRNYNLKKRIEQQQVILNERKRISTELHDDLGAQLSVAKIFLHNLKTGASTDQDAQLIENSLGMVESSITHLKHLMNELQNTTLEERGYIAATEELVNKLASLRKIKFSLSHSGMDKRIDKKTEHQLFRATQELINNTLKHASAQTISIDVVNNDKQLTLLFEDDGTGFDLSRIELGNGINNISRRIADLHGHITFDTQIGKGCRTIIEIEHINN